MSDVLALWNSGNDTMEIARRLNTTEAAVYNALAKVKGQRTESNNEELRRKRRTYSYKLRHSGITGERYRKAVDEFISDLRAAL